MSDSGSWPPGPPGGGNQPSDEPSQGGWGQQPQQPYGQPQPPYGGQPGYGNPGGGGWQQPGAAGGYAGQQPWASGPPPMGAYRGGYGGATPPVAKPNGTVFLVLGILETLFCCLPFGIVTIVFSTQVNSRWNIGDYAGSAQAARRAKTWCIVAAACGVAVWVIYLIYFAVAANHNS